MVHENKGITEESNLTYSFGSHCSIDISARMQIVVKECGKDCECVVDVNNMGSLACLCCQAIANVL